MIVLNVTYKCKTAKRDEYLEAIRRERIDKASRAEAGNLKYDYYISTEDTDEVLLIEKWKDAEAIEFHKNQEHFAKLGELKAEFVEETIIDKFVI